MSTGTWLLRNCLLLLLYFHDFTSGAIDVALNVVFISHTSSMILESILFYYLKYPFGYYICWSCYCFIAVINFNVSLWVHTNLDFINQFFLYIYKMSVFAFSTWGSECDLVCFLITSKPKVCISVLIGTNILPTNFVGGISSFKQIKKRGWKICFKTVFGILLKPPPPKKS